MRPRQRQGLFAGIAVLAASSVVLQIAFTRLYSALFGSHLAFLAISLSLFGVGVGGMLLHVFPSLARPPFLLARLGYLSGLAAAATVAALLVVLHQKPIENLDGTAIGRLAVLYVTSSLPFVLAGVALAAAVRHASREMSRLYLVDLVGAACGGVLAIAALRAGGPRAGLFVAILQAIAAVIFYYATPPRDAVADGEPLEHRPSGPVIATFALASLVLLAGDLGAPWLKLPPMRWAANEKIEFHVWNELALVTVDKPHGGTALMRTDGSSSSAILDPKNNPPLHPDEMAYVLHREKGPVLVIGPGGGHDLRAALKYGQTEIYAAEINPAVANDVMRARYKDFSGGLYDKPEVHVTVADGRSYVRRSPIQFRNIVLSLVDTSAASSVGALALAENSLYTTEAFRDYLNHLVPEGTVLVNRPDAELDRLLALGVAGLRAVGVADPAKHLYGCGAARSTSLLIKRTPLAANELDLLRRNCKKNKFTETFAPDDPHGEVHGFLATQSSTPIATSDLSAPTDDRPFFFYTVPARRLAATLGDIKGMSANNQGLLTLAGLFVVSVGLAVLFLLGPLLLRRSAPGGVKQGGRLRPLVFFGCLGAGFVLVEVALVQRFVMFLGHPVYALSTVLVALLLWAGIGSVLTGRFDEVTAEPATGKRAQLLVVALAAYAIALGPALDAAVVLPLGARIGLTLVLLAPIGLLMGSQAPLGVKLLAGRAPDLLAWCWGIGGVASVVATAVGTLLAMQFGFSAVLLAGGASYLVAAAAVPRAVSEAETAGA